MSIQSLVRAVRLVVFPLAIVALARATLVAITVESTSMAPILKDGDRVLVWRRWPARWLRKGQIVIVWPWLLLHTGPRHPSAWTFTPFIKRVIGLPGETVTTATIDALVATGSHNYNPQIAGKQNRSNDPARVDKIEGAGTWQVPQGHLFVCGDNLAFSNDSREWGPIPTGSVLGVVIMRLPRKTSAGLKERQRREEP